MPLEIRKEFVEESLKAVLEESQMEPLQESQKESQKKLFEKEFL